MTDELKALLKAAKTDEEAKEILLANKSELTDEDLEKVNGGDLTDFLDAFVQGPMDFYMSVYECGRH